MKKTIIAALVSTSLLIALIGWGVYKDNEDRIVIDKQANYQIVAYGDEVYIEGNSIYGNSRTLITDKKTGEPITYDEYISTHKQILVN